MSLDNDDQSIESLLRAIPLRNPSERLDARVEAVFDQHRRTTPVSEVLPRPGSMGGRSGSSEYLRERRRLFISPVFSRPVVHRFATAAGILLAIAIGVRLSLPGRSVPVAIAPVLPTHPIRFEQETSAVYDDGVVGTGDSAYQQYRRRTVREIYYEEPGSHAKLQVTIPTEQVVIRKVEFD